LKSVDCSIIAKVMADVVKELFLARKNPINLPGTTTKTMAYFQTQKLIE
jgi:hypothetical protein